MLLQTLGWADCSVEGTDNCKDTDGCKDDPCFPGVACTDVPSPGAGFVCGACPPGLSPPVDRPELDG